MRALWGGLYSRGVVMRVHWSAALVPVFTAAATVEIRGVEAWPGADNRRVRHRPVRSSVRSGCRRTGRRGRVQFEGDGDRTATGSGEQSDAMGAGGSGVTLRTACGGQDGEDASR